MPDTFDKNSMVVNAMPKDNGVEVLLKCSHAWGAEGEFGDTFLTEHDLRLMLITIEVARANA